WHPKAGVYYMPDTLAFMPTVGFPLRPHNRYALVVTSALQDKKGLAVAQNPTVAQLVGATPSTDATSAASAALASAVTQIEAAGIGKERIVHLAVFTTADPTKELIAVRDGVSQTIQAPTADPNLWVLANQGPAHDEYKGFFGPSPNYQAG